MSFLSCRIDLRRGVRPRELGFEDAADLVVLQSFAAQLVDEIAAVPLGERGANFVRMLADNHRLGYLPEIAELFDTLKDDAEGMVDVTVTSAAPLDEAQRGQISAALERRLRRKVRLHCETDPALIGGAVLRAGDLVIDGSLRTRLERIAYELTA